MDADELRDIRDHVDQIAERRATQGGNIEVHKRNVLGELAFARAFDLYPGPIRSDDPVFDLDGVEIRVVTTGPRVPFVMIPREWIDRLSFVVVAMHYPATAAASLIGWMDDEGCDRSAVERKGEAFIPVMIRDLWTINGLRDDIERRVAEECARMLLQERRTIAGGSELIVNWWPDHKSAAIVVDNQCVDYIYKVVSNPLNERWYCVSTCLDNRGFATWQAARDYAIECAKIKAEEQATKLSTPPVDFAAFRQRRMSPN